MSPTFRSTFPRQLRFWAFHCCLGALPSFFIAVIFTSLHTNVEAVTAMLSATGIFILSYAAITSFVPALSDERHILARALKVGVKARCWLSAFILLIPPLGVLLILPDVSCFWISALIVSLAARELGLKARLMDTPGMAGFGEMFITTIIQGVMLSFTVLFFSFCAAMILQSRDREEFFASEEKRRAARHRDRHPGLPDMDT